VRLKLLQTTRVKTALRLVLTLNVLSRPLRQRLKSAPKHRQNPKMGQPMCLLKCLPKRKRTLPLWLPKLQRLLWFRILW
jgi:hypothetical protein